MSIRSKSVGTKVTVEEFAAFERIAGGRRISEWVREVLLGALATDPRDVALMAEVLALRMILLNLHFSIASGQVMTAEAMRRLIETADREKSSAASQRLAPQATRA